MGLDKIAASARISRYESGAMSISLEALFELAEALEVPPAFLLASSPSMAGAILALNGESQDQQDHLAQVLTQLTKVPLPAREELIRRLLTAPAGK